MDSRPKYESNDCLVSLVEPILMTVTYMLRCNSSIESTTGSVKVFDAFMNLRKTLNPQGISMLEDMSHLEKSLKELLEILVSACFSYTIYGIIHFYILNQ
jgi:hypothetical protein